VTLALTRKELLAVDNMAIIMKAKQDGLKVYASDLRINYAEMDHMLTELEDGWMDAAAEVMVKIMTAWASKIKTKEDMEKESGMAADFQRLLLAFIRSIWDYGQSTADVELLEAGLAEFDETKTNDDAFAWYQLYTKELAKQTDKAAFHYMQPTILEHLDQGTVGTKLAAELEDDFRRFGQVRTKIIARTESNKAFNWGRRYRFDQSKAIAGYRYSAILDERTTEICQALHGHSWAITDPALDQHTPPNHFMCRSVIVPISKYVTWEFDPPPAGWEKDLPMKEQTVFSKFKSSEFYPKAETVKTKEVPTMEKPKAQKKAAKEKPAPKKTQVQDEPNQLIEDLIKLSHDQAVQYFEEFISVNKKRGVKADHPGLKAAARFIDEIQSGGAEGRMIAADFNTKRKEPTLKFYERRGDIFWRRGSSAVSAKDRDRMLQEIDQAAKDPLFAGVKFELIQSKTKLGSYNPKTDTLEYTPAASLNSKRSVYEAAALGTLFHEVGHRVHNIKSIYSSVYQSSLREAGITMLDDQWEEWVKVVEPFWSVAYTPVGSDHLPADLSYRYEYPINAKQHYKRGTKANFQKEMFAETTAVYLENNEQEMAKVERTYPGLLSFMESVYNKGYYKGGV
jgi:SPP1 gp7 family putative phage head morphogenesis protein